ncbi:hypothetical protein Q5752_003841 [Cryptotrichosporon argae]
MTITPARVLRIGIDCGGTNTDAVIVDLTPGAPEVVLAATKSPTTPEVTHGIQSATSTVLRMRPEIHPSHIQALSIGTTHFVNALIQRSEDRLERVAVIRLCGPFSRPTPPFTGFPYELREILQGPLFFVNGGLQIDGSEITQNIRAVAISGVYAPIDFNLKQEEAVATIVHRLVPGVYTTCSKTVANIGMLERENATILNTSLLPFAQNIVNGFRTAAQELGLSCPVFVNGNDGTLLGLDQASSLPIKTFSSGPTNSMRGASFLASLADPDAKRETALVVDIGGTTTEIGVLLPSGFPRQAASHHELCGVKLNFAMPHVTSIGLGGGSLVRQTGFKVTVGPDSVGYKILEEALVFGGQTLTATDVAVRAGSAESANVGDAVAVAHLEPMLIEAAQARIKTMLELSIDSMKTSAADIPVYLVGGGAILAPKHLRGVSKVHRFPHYQCANAVGAAIAQVAGVVDSVEETNGRPLAEIRLEVEARAVARAVQAGALADTVKVIESEVIPIAYVAGRCRFYVKAAGEWGGSVALDTNHAPVQAVALRFNPRINIGKVDVPWHPADILAYKPNVRARTWELSEIDLEWICIGTYILGCGGGGDPSHTFLAAREMVRAGATIRVVDLAALDKNALVGWGGGMGSPEVASERMIGEEYNEATEHLQRFMGIDRLSALAALEIGGSNGMINMLTGASCNHDLPILDGDFMGRAYPTGWQVTPNVFDKGTRGENILPGCIASGDGNVMFMTHAKNDRMIDSSLRAACVEMGTLVGHANRPLSAEFCETAMVKNTVSLSWRLGRTVMLANKQAQIANIGSLLVDALGGSDTARVLFAGKVVEVNRRSYKGHSVGELVVAAVEAEDESMVFEGVVKIPFKNENLYCAHTANGKTEVIATVPDLVCVLDAGNGHALGTPDYKYGQHVLVLGVTAAPQWTSTSRGLELGDLRAFGFANIPYKPLGRYVKPASVIDEYTK